MWRSTKPMADGEIDATRGAGLHFVCQCSQVFLKCYRSGSSSAPHSLRRWQVQRILPHAAYPEKKNARWWDIVRDNWKRWTQQVEGCGLPSTHLGQSLTALSRQKQQVKVLELNSSGSVACHGHGIWPPNPDELINSTTLGRPNSAPEREPCLHRHSKVFLVKPEA